MLQLDWYDGTEQAKPLKIKKFRPYDTNRIKTVQYAFWAEHCLECSPPECYKTCDYYERRSDGRCRRTYHGQQFIPIKGSVDGYGTLFTFRPWAKIETYIYGSYYTPKEYFDISKKYYAEIKRYNKLGSINIRHVFNNASYFVRTRFRKKDSDESKKINTFLFELYSFDKDSYRMIIESEDINKKVQKRTSVEIIPGFNSFELPYSEVVSEETNVVHFYPENDKNATVLIVNSCFVEIEEKENFHPANKVKCVAWDLDNTLWDGTLSEVEDASKLELQPGVKDLIENLDKRGILQTIVSKNDYDPAWNHICELGIDKYFLYPAINWNRKSENLKSVARELNINVDTFALIDDSAFERGEVSENLPQVRVYDENVLGSLLMLPEFDIPITEESAKRREMYQTEVSRKQVYASKGGDYLEFIRSCDMMLSIGQLDSNSDNEIVKRCYELVNRTNQLNISGHRYTENEFIRLLDKDQHIYFRCEDKYGKYGLVGYISFIAADGNVTINEMAISCRVAQKHVEYAVLSWIARNYAFDEMIRIRFIRTEKNRPMLRTLNSIGFISDGNEMMIYSKDISNDDRVIQIAEI